MATLSRPDIPYFTVRVLSGIPNVHILTPMSNHESDESLNALIRLTLVNGLGPILISRLLERFNDDPIAVTKAAPTAIESIKGISSARARIFHRDLREVDPENERRLAENNGVQIIAYNDPRYPALLRLISDRPPLLYVKGSLNEQTHEADHYAVAIVGSRRCSAYGRDQTGRFSIALSQAGFTIVSGGARGIDTEAHRGALQAAGRTIVVLGCGMNHVYPRENASLFESVAENGGAILSEFPMDMGPAPENFPRRNRIISGLSLGTLVIEAPNHSGALITARLACEDHNREVMAMPGRIDSKTSIGCHRIIQEGWARLVTKPSDVLETLQDSAHLIAASKHTPIQTHVGSSKTPDTSEPLFDTDTNENVAKHGLSPTQQKILDQLISTESIEIGQLAGQTGIEVGRLQSDLTILQIRGLIARTPNAGITRK